MGSREKIEIPTISFTAVTHLGSTGNSSCPGDGLTDGSGKPLTISKVGCPNDTCPSDCSSDGAADW